ncbi:MAG: 2-oxo acid dehydrogenase subunit E2, partial [Devosia sp.]
MSTEIRVPTLGESVTEATIGQWFKKVGDTVAADEPVVELETDKVTIEVPAPAGGVLEAIAANPGDTVNVGALIGAISAGGAKPAASAPAAEKPAPAAAAPQVAQAAPASAPAAPATSMPPAPAAAKIAADNGLDTAAIAGSGKRGQVLKEDVLAAARQPAPQAPKAAPQAEQKAPQPAAPAPAVPAQAPRAEDEAGREERVKMTRLRQTIARRLKDAQNTAAMLTTFNEVDMKPVMELRNRYKDLFEKKHGVKLGFMGFFTKAVVHALKEIPAVNAEIDGDAIIYKNYAHIGVAVGTEKGLVVPVVRDADQMSIA